MKRAVTSYDTKKSLSPMRRCWISSEKWKMWIRVSTSRPTTSPDVDEKLKPLSINEYTISENVSEIKISCKTS